MKFLNVLALLICSTLHCYSQLNVTYINATQFMQHWAAPNVTITNPVFSGVDPSQMASFSGTTNPNLGIPHGIMLASGDAMIAADTTNNYMAGTALGGGGDADLSGACQQPTKDLAAIEFDFSSPTDTVEFSFIFASEEYNYWVDRYKNDVCGARLYNAGGGYATVIYLPGTFTPVCVNNVNNGTVSNIGDPSTGPCMNCQYFVDNTYGTTFQFNGYTTLITIRLHVTPCAVRHFWIGVADAQDFIYDAAIFLPDSSFRAVGTPVISAAGSPQGTDTISMCPGDTVTLVSTQASSYSWSNGATTQSIVVNAPGDYYLTGPCGALSNHIVVDGMSSAVVDTSFCSNSSLTVNVAVTNATYLWQDSSTGSSYQFNSGGNYWVRINDGTCAYTDTFHVNTISAPLVNLGNDLFVCDTNGTWLNAGNPAATHLWNTGAQAATIHVTQSGLYWAEVSDSGCISRDTVMVAVSQMPEAIFVAVLVPSCEGTEVKLVNTSTNEQSVLWLFGDGTSLADANLNPLDTISHAYAYGSSFNLNLVAINNFCRDTMNLQVNDVDLSGGLGLLPNVFTPNGDGLNECFGLDVAGRLTECAVITVFNRWGTKIFEGNQSHPCWNGKTPAGDDCDEGVYFFTIAVGNATKNGTVQLFRK